MKKVILLIIAIVTIMCAVNAQVEPHAIGVRGNAGNYGVGPELSYQHGLGDVSRVEVGLGFSADKSFNRIGFSGAFHWTGEVQNGFSWFAGPAVQGSLYSFSALVDDGELIRKNSSFGGSVGAQVGVEYDFNEYLDLPFTASLDSRPMYNFVSYYSGFEFAVGLSIRYTF